MGIQTLGNPAADFSGGEHAPKKPNWLTCCRGYHQFLQPWCSDVMQTTANITSLAGEPCRKLSKVYDKTTPMQS